MQSKSSSRITEQEHQASVRVKEDSSEEMIFKLCFSAFSCEINVVNQLE